MIFGLKTGMMEAQKKLALKAFGGKNNGDDSGSINVEINSGAIILTCQDLDVKNAFAQSFFFAALAIILNSPTQEYLLFLSG